MWVTGEVEHAMSVSCSSGIPVVAAVLRSLDLVVGTGVPPVSGGTSQGTTVAHVVARPVLETPFLANPGVIWGVPFGVAAAVVWVVAVVSDAVPAVIVTTGKFTRRLNRLTRIGAVKVEWG